MTSINLRPDDAGIRNLKNDNTRPASTQEVDHVPPYPNTHPVKSGMLSPVEQENLQRVQQAGTPQTEEETAQQTLMQERRQRRDRRKKQVPVILDTRSRQQRRLATSNPREGDEEGDAGMLGIDTYT